MCKHPVALVLTFYLPTCTVCSDTQLLYLLGFESSFSRQHFTLMSSGPRISLVGSTVHHCVASFSGPHACFTLATCGPGTFSHTHDMLGGK